MQLMAGRGPTSRLPQRKIRERLNQINQERARLEDDPQQSGSALAAVSRSKPAYIWRRMCVLCMRSP
jgi:hypothetical protein